MSFSATNLSLCRQSVSACGRDSVKAVDVFYFTHASVGAEDHVEGNVFRGNVVVGVVEGPSVAIVQGRVEVFECFGLGHRNDPAGGGFESLESAVFVPTEAQLWSGAAMGRFDVEEVGASGEEIAFLDGREHFCHCHADVDGVVRRLGLLV
jgi:hypothetical protein